VTSFALTAQPWIPIMHRGVRTEVSLRDALLRADELDGLALEDPLATVAILRQVLLPVVFDALGVPRNESEWEDHWAAGRLDGAAIERYLDEHADRFDLFHDSRPFAQVSGLRTAKDETKPTSVLLAAAATGNNVPLFSARTEADPPALTPAQAVRALLSTHCWDTAAIKSGAVGDPQVKAGKTTGNPTGPLGNLGVVVPMGATLFETIMLNTPFIQQGLEEEDRPQWRADAATPAWATRPASGLLDLLTWQSRRIRLVPEQDDQGRTVVRRVVLAAGDRLEPLPEEYEPHTAWRQVSKRRPGDPPRRPIRHQPGRAPWRGMSSLLATQSNAGDEFDTAAMLAQLGNLQVDGRVPEDLQLQILTVGVSYGNQNAVIEDVMTDTLPLPVAALDGDSPVRDLLLLVAEQAERLRVAANNLGDDLRKASGGDKLPWDKSLRLGEELVHEFTPVVRRMLGGLQREPHRWREAQHAWKVTARRLALAAAEPAIAATPSTAFRGRKVTEKSWNRISVAEARYQRAIKDVLGPVKDWTLGTGAA
jgi:CRISPR system Cascade subunit CasA